ncbi:hypothetical protein DFH27DRAFT_633520 [Peziza echinospora]|nr:hypothetical protein DFH27DRAFT_633520 [Peziza echinospora]
MVDGDDVEEAAGGGEGRNGRTVGVSSAVSDVPDKLLGGGAVAVVVILTTVVPGGHTTLARTLTGRWSALDVSDEDQAPGIPANLTQPAPTGFAFVAAALSRQETPPGHPHLAHHTTFLAPPPGGFVHVRGQQLGRVDDGVVVAAVVLGIQGRLVLATAVESVESSRVSMQERGGSSSTSTAMAKCMRVMGDVHALGLARRCSTVAQCLELEMLKRI